MNTETINDLLVNIDSQIDTGAAGLLVHEYMTNHELNPDEQLVIMAALSRKIHESRFSKTMEASDEGDDGNQSSANMTNVCPAENQATSPVHNADQTEISADQEPIAPCNAEAVTEDTLPTTLPKLNESVSVQQEEKNINAHEQLQNNEENELPKQQKKPDKGHVMQQKCDLQTQEKLLATTSVDNADRTETSTDQEKNPPCNADAVTEDTLPMALKLNEPVSVQQEEKNDNAHEQKQNNEDKELPKQQKKPNKGHLKEQKCDLQKQEKLLLVEQQLAQEQQQAKLKAEQRLKESQTRMEEQYLRDKQQRLQEQQQLKQKLQQKMEEDRQLKEQLSKDRQTLQTEKELKKKLQWQNVKEDQKIVDEPLLEDKQKKLLEEQHLKQKLEQKVKAAQQLKEQQKKMEEQALKDKQQKLQEEHQLQIKLQQKVKEAQQQKETQKRIEEQELKDKQQKLQEEQQLKIKLQQKVKEAREYKEQQKKIELQQLKEERQKLQQKLQIQKAKEEQQKVKEDQLLNDKQKTFKKQQDLQLQKPESGEQDNVLTKQQQKSVTKLQNHEEVQHNVFEQQYGQDKLLRKQKVQLMYQKLKEQRHKVKFSATFITHKAADSTMQMSNTEVKSPLKSTVTLPQSGPTQLPSKITTETQEAIATSAESVSNPVVGKMDCSTTTKQISMQQRPQNAPNAALFTQQCAMPSNNSVQFHTTQLPPSHNITYDSHAQPASSYTNSAVHQIVLQNNVLQQHIQNPHVEVCNTNTTNCIENLAVNQVLHQPQEPLEKQNITTLDSAAPTDRSAYEKVAWAAYYASAAAVDYAMKPKQGEMSVDDYAAHCLKYYRELAENENLGADKPKEKPGASLMPSSSNADPPYMTLTDTAAFKTPTHQPPPNAANIAAQPTAKGGAVNVQPQALTYLPMATGGAINLPQQALPYHHHMPMTVPEATESPIAPQGSLQADYAAYYRWVEDMQKQPFKSFEEQNNFNQHASNWFAHLEQRELALKNAAVANIERQFYSQSQCYGSFSKPSAGNSIAHKPDVTSCPTLPLPSITVHPVVPVEPSWTATRNYPTTTITAAKDNAGTATSGYSSFPPMQQSNQSTVDARLPESHSKHNTETTNVSYNQVDVSPKANMEPKSKAIVKEFCQAKIRKTRWSEKSEPLVKTNHNFPTSHTEETTQKNVGLVADYKDDDDHCEQPTKHPAEISHTKNATPNSNKRPFNNGQKTENHVSLSSRRTALWNRYQRKKSLFTSTAEWDRYLAMDVKGPWPPESAAYGGNAQEDEETYFDGIAFGENIDREKQIQTEKQNFENSAHIQTGGSQYSGTNGNANLETGFGEWQAIKYDQHVSYVHVSPNRQNDNNTYSCYEYSTSRTAITSPVKPIPSLFDLQTESPQQPVESPKRLNPHDVAYRCDAPLIKKRKEDEQLHCELPTEQWIFQGKDEMEPFNVTESHSTTKVDLTHEISTTNSIINVPQSMGNMYEDKVTKLPESREIHSQLSQSASQQPANVTTVHSDMKHAFRTPLLKTTPKSTLAVEPPVISKPVENNINHVIIETSPKEYKPEGEVKGSQKEKVSMQEVQKAETTAPPDEKLDTSNVNNTSQLTNSKKELNCTHSNDLDNAPGSNRSLQMQTTNESISSKNTSPINTAKTLVDTDRVNEPNSGRQTVKESKWTHSNDPDSAPGSNNSLQIQTNNESISSKNTAPTNEQHAGRATVVPKPTLRSSFFGPAHSTVNTSVNPASQPDRTVQSVSPPGSLSTLPSKISPSGEKDSEIELQTVSTSSSLGLDGSPTETANLGKGASYDDLFMDTLPDMLPLEQKKKTLDHNSNGVNDVGKQSSQKKIQDAAAEVPLDKPERKAASDTIGPAAKQVKSDTLNASLTKTAYDGNEMKRRNATKQSRTRTQPKKQREPLLRASPSQFGKALPSHQPSFTRSVFGAPNNFNHKPRQQLPTLSNAHTGYANPANSLIPQRFAYPTGNYNASGSERNYVAPGSSHIPLISEPGFGKATHIPPQNSMPPLHQYTFNARQEFGPFRYQ